MATPSRALTGVRLWLLCRVLAEQDPEKRAQMMDAIDMCRGASLSRQSAQSKEEVRSSQ